MDIQVNTVVKPPTEEELTPKNFPGLKNDNILRAIRGQPVDRIPVWIMRQAGRFLPEFRAFRAVHDFFKICRTPELACEVTLMPIRRFDLDAAIIFSDILVVPQALGMEVKMVESVGPVFPDPIRNPEDFENKLNKDNALENLSYVGKALTVTRHRLNGKVPLIGFSGGPWTLFSYMVEGGGSKTYTNAKRFLYEFKEQSIKALNMLTKVIIDYLILQVESGAQLLQVFESNAEYLSPELLREFLEPCLKTISKEVKTALCKMNSESVPLIIFCKGGSIFLKEQINYGYDVIGIDWTIDPAEARKITGPNVTLQGNLDPPALFSNKEDLILRTVNMVTSLKTKSNSHYIANLGHGIYPQCEIEKVEVFIKTIHEQ